MCTAKIVGEYHADYKGSKAYNTTNSYAFVTNGVIEGGSDRIILKKDGSARMEGSKEGYDLNWTLTQWLSAFAAGRNDGTGK